MRVAVLFSGGKDSVLAVHRCIKAGHQVIALIHVVPTRPSESRLYHLPNALIPLHQARAMNIPLIQVFSNEESEKEIQPLSEVLFDLKKKQGLECVVTGAVASTYQSTRFEKMADELGLECVHPLWQIDSRALWKELLSKKFGVHLAAVAAQGLTPDWLGQKMNAKKVKDLFLLSKKFGVHPAGEGGEFETVVLNAPLFSYPLVVKKVVTNWVGSSGTWEILEMNEKKTIDKKRRPQSRTRMRA